MFPFQVIICTSQQYPSGFESLALFYLQKEKSRTLCDSFFLAESKGFCPGATRAFRLASLVAPSAETVHRTVSFRKLRLLPPCSNPLLLNI